MKTAKFVLLTICLIAALLVSLDKAGVQYTAMLILTLLSTLSLLSVESTLRGIRAELERRR